jgi:FixJ family two-component response regulator
MTDARPTVLIVDDDPAIRRAVARLVRAAGYDVQTFSSPVSFLRQQLPAGPACVLLDMQMEGMTGLDVQDALARNERHVPIVFLSGHGTISSATASIKHGADDFLEKPIQPDQLIRAIERAVRRDASQSTARAEREELDRRYHTLTARERDVMQLIVTGLLNKQAAAELGISEKTIKVHRARVMDKMRAPSLASLVRMSEQVQPAIPQPADS